MLISYPIPTPKRKKIVVVIFLPTRFLPTLLRALSNIPNLLGSTRKNWLFYFIQFDTMTWVQHNFIFSYKYFDFPIKNVYFPLVTVGMYAIYMLRKRRVILHQRHENWMIGRRRTKDIQNKDIISSCVYSICTVSAGCYKNPI